jgi:hypothetical protein
MSTDPRGQAVRRKAQRQGYILRKSRIDGTWLVIDPEHNGIVAGGESAQSDGTNGWLLEDVEAWLDRNDMTSDAREQAVRRKAQRQGYMLRKSRIDGTWLVIDPERNWIVVGGESAQSGGTTGWLLEDVEAWLDQEE